MKRRFMGSEEGNWIPHSHLIAPQIIGQMTKWPEGDQVVLMVN